MSDSVAAVSRVSPPAAAAVTAIPREVLTWLQSLNLGTAVKNPKRDLANGCVIAQICAHYWPQVPLHSFINGASTASKQSNWYVLQKLMRKHDIAISPAMVGGMVKGDDDCALAFLKQLYTLFTGKTLEEAPVPLAESLTAVPSAEVPVLTAATVNNTAARARQAAENATASSSSTRWEAAARTGDRGVRFGVSDSNEAVAFFNNHNASSGGQAAVTGAAATRSAVPAVLPPIVPPTPTPVPFSAATAASGKPVLNVAVRPAGQVSTVLAAASSTTTDDAAAAAVTAGAPQGKPGDAWSHPAGASVATAWFCAKVREALPTEVLEALANSNSRSLSPAAPFASSLAWLAAADGVFDADFEYSREGEEPVRESQAVLRERVWQSLLSNAHELADVVVHHAVHGLDVVVDALFAAVRDTTVCDADGQEVRTGVLFVRHTLQLCTALLSFLSDVDAHLAVRCFQLYFVASDTFAAAVCRVRWCVARGYAELIVSALPTNRGVATAVLESLWESLEDVVCDAAEDTDAVSSPSEVSLLTLLRALVAVLLSLHTGAAVTPAPSTSTAQATVPAAVDGPRRPSQRVRGAYAATTAVGAATIEEDTFGAVVARTAHQRCTAALRRLHTTAAAVVDTALAETATALAVDLLRVELATPLVAEFVTGEAFFDVFHTLFPVLEGRREDDDDADDDAHDDAARSSLCVRHPTLAVLRARWLRWCLQRQWQLGLLTGRLACTAATSLLSSPQAAQRCSPSLDGTAGGGVAGDGDGSVNADDEGKVDSEEVRAGRHGVRVVCAELFAASPAEGEANVRRTDEVARVLMAATMAESVLFLPPQYKASEAAGDSVGGKAEGNGAGRPVQLLPAHSDGENGSADSSGSHQHHLPRHPLPPRGEVVYAEAVAEACLHVLMREATPAQVQALLTAAPQHAGKASSSEKSPSPEAAAEVDAEERAAVTLTHPLVGSLVPYGPLVLRSDVLLLVKAMLCVLDTVTAAATAANATAAVERDVAAVARRLGARAAVVAREGQVEERTAARIHWMHALLVEGRRPSLRASPPAAPAGGASASAATSTAAAVVGAAAGETSPPPLLTSPIADATVLQWHAVILECWDSWMLVLQAATLRLRQRGGTSTAATGQVATSLLLREALGEQLLTCAQQAQEVVCCLEKELSAALPGRTAVADMSTSASGSARTDGVTLSSALLSGPMASFVAGCTPEALQAAVGWMWAVVGGS